jgi:hypothetical protein
MSVNTRKEKRKQPFQPAACLGGGAQARSNVCQWALLFGVAPAVAHGRLDVAPLVEAPHAHTLAGRADCSLHTRCSYQHQRDC